MTTGKEDKPLRAWPASQSLKDFMALYGGIYEKSPWIAERVYAVRKNIGTAGDLLAAMKAVVDGASRERKLALIRAHPMLACAKADPAAMTAHSVSEQKGAGLDACTQEEFVAFERLNAAYGEKFGFPFIIAVKGLSRQDILSAFQKRLENAPEAEFAAALEQIHKIARLRLMAM